jgi:hypothetical protein
VCALLHVGYDAAAAGWDSTCMRGQRSERMHANSERVQVKALLLHSIQAACSKRAWGDGMLQVCEGRQDAPWR